MDDLRLRRVLRSALALSLATPAAVAAACGVSRSSEDEEVFEAGAPDAEAVDGCATYEAGSVLTAPTKACVRHEPFPCGEEPDKELRSTLCQARCAPFDDLGRHLSACRGVRDEAGAPVLECDYKPIGPGVCGCAELEPTRPCVTHHQFPCGEAVEDAELGIGFCQTRCAATDSAGRPLQRCRGVRDKTSSPVLECDYKPADPKACGCANLAPRAACTSVVQFPCGEAPEDAVLPMALCQARCASTDGNGRALQSCRGVRDDAGAPVLECDYSPADPAKACGCARFDPTCEGAQLPCDVDASTITPELCRAHCDRTTGLRSCNRRQDSRGVEHLCCNYNVFGRRPDGLVEAAGARGTAVGVWLAEASRMEAASVVSFAVLGEELEAQGAPAELRERAKRAEADEVRHARMTAKLARRLGAEEGAWSLPPEVTRRAGRTLEAMALENAVEGCVLETFAALLAMWQAERARDVGVRAAMRAIAEDETRHAALAWSVGEWIAPRLDADARARVERAQRDAVASLAEASKRAAPRELVEAGLLPGAPEAERLVAALRATLWSDSTS